MLEGHAADFIGTWSSPLPGHGVYGEQDAESIHKLFRLLQRAYCSMQAATICLQVMLKKNIIARLVHPGAKALKSGIIKRKWHPKGDQVQYYHKNIGLNLLYECNIRALLG